MTPVRIAPIPKPPAAPPDLGAVRAAAARCGISLYDDAYGTGSRIETRGSSPAGSRVSFADGTLAWLPGASVLALDGDDALRFLHSQTTNDVLQQSPGTARWHGYCSPKGRLLATMLAWRTSEKSLRLLLPDSVAETIRRRLAMFVLRSKVRIANDSGALVVLGVSGAAGADALSVLRLAPPSPMKVAVADDAGNGHPSGSDEPPAHRLTAIGLPPLPAQAANGADADVPRWLLVVPVGCVDEAWNALRATLVPIDSRAWRWTDVRSGVASIVAATSEQFVPQMLNLEADAIGAVSFTKGCYPGQEVVARSHYLGKTKRRAFLARIASPAGSAAREPAPGSDVLDAAGQPVGLVVAAAASPDGAIDVLYQAQVAAAQEGALGVDGQALQPLALPYPLEIA